MVIYSNLYHDKKADFNWLELNYRRGEQSFPNVAKWADLCFICAHAALPAQF